MWGTAKNCEAGETALLNYSFINKLINRVNGNLSVITCQSREGEELRKSVVGG